MISDLQRQQGTSDAAIIEFGDTPALVWDWPLRVFHWAIAATVTGAFVTHWAGLEWFEWHRRLGYVSVVLVAFRILWGFAGPRYSRFTSFVRGPWAVADYVRGGAKPGAAGHNPIGGWSVVAFLLALAVQAATGLFANDEIANVGPFFGYVSESTSGRLTALHEATSNVLLALIALHVAAIAWYDHVRKLGLVRAMLDGRRRGVEGIRSSRGVLAVLLVAALAAVFAWAVRTAPEASLSFY